MTETATDNRNALTEPIRKTVGGRLEDKPPIQRLEALWRNANSILGPDWRGKDDGTLVRKVVGKTD